MKWEIPMPAEGSNAPCVVHGEFGELLLKLLRKVPGAGDGPMERHEGEDVVASRIDQLAGVIALHNRPDPLSELIELLGSL